MSELLSGLLKIELYIDCICVDVATLGGGIRAPFPATLPVNTTFEPMIRLL